MCCKSRVTRLKEFGKTTKPYYQGFEDNFKPHITIARNISENKLLKAKKQLRKPILCQTKKTELSLTIMNQTDINAAHKHYETIHYEFKTNP